MAVGAPGLVPYARVRHQRHRAHPARGPGHRRRPTTAATSTRWRWRSRSPSGAGPVRFLGKKEVFDAPIVGELAGPWAASASSGARASDEPLKAALAALEAGEMVALMPQGTIPRGEAFFDPVLKGRWGAARLAAMTGAPVIPIGLWGTEKVWPRSERLPNMLNVTNPPLDHDPGGRAGRRSTARTSTPTRSGSWRPSSTCCRPRRTRCARAHRRRAGPDLPARQGADRRRPRARAPPRQGLGATVARPVARPARSCRWDR